MGARTGLRKTSRDPWPRGRVKNRSSIQGELCALYPDWVDKRVTTQRSQRGNDIATPQSVVTPSICKGDAYAMYGLALDVVCKSVEAKIAYASQPISLRTGDL